MDKHIFYKVAFTLGITLFKVIDFKQITLKDLVLDFLYLIVFVISISFMTKDYLKQPKK